MNACTTQEFMAGYFLASCHAFDGKEFSVDTSKSEPWQNGYNAYVKEGEPSDETESFLNLCEGA